jgi:uncharacterized protein (DUF302 family)
MRRVAASVVLAVLATAPVSAQVADLVVAESKLSVKDSLDAMAKAVESKGAKVVARVDHAAGAKAVGMDLKPSEVIIFGNPKLGTPLMQSKPEIGLDLPLKALAWQDASGKVFVAYTNPDALKARYGIKDKDDVFKAMAGALAGFSAAATGK